MRIATLLPLGLLLSGADTADILSRPIPSVTNTTETVTRGSEAEVSSALVSMVIGLCLVIVLIGLAAWLWRRFGLRLPPQQAGARHLEVIEYLPLGFKRSVCLVRCGQAHVLVSQYEGGLSQPVLLPAESLGSGPLSGGATEAAQATAQDQPAQQTASAHAAHAPPALSDFKQRLRKLTGGGEA